MNNEIKTGRGGARKNSGKKSKWLQSQLHAQGGEVGDLMALSFGGKKVTKAGWHFNAYTLVVEKV
ncbi:MAG: hypothetical protein PHN45_09520 [Methylococcales bacterium]|nr:hypothetical protein [Methylococcales bacterium]MDD5754979.1 hypothetical protein [Methylococcales bacterium]